MEENQEQQVLEGTESTAPAGDNGQQEGAAAGQEENPESAEGQEQQSQQSMQERARQAEGRRIREREQRAAEAAYRQARDDMSAILKSIGIVNPQTGGIVSSVEEMETYAQALSEKRMKEGRPNEADLRRIVRETVQESRQQPPAPQGKDPVIERELAEIRAMDPEMKDLPTILRSEAGDKFREYVGKGLTFLEAYTLAAKDRLARISGNRERARTGGKEHLANTATRGKGEISVPPGVMAQYHILLPDATDEEIRKHYVADQKRLRK